jgi:hypothetical protein
MCIWLLIFVDLVIGSIARRWELLFTESAGHIMIPFLPNPLVLLVL